jgi:haloacetate dehalogenase
MLEGFTRREIRTSGATIVTLQGGKGPPLLLLHGNPFTHLSWHSVAPALAQNFTVVCTDLRGYGDSSKPPDGENHINYSFRAMAQDQIEVMETLGFRRFAVAGHDRGARVAHRMCLDHPERVERVAFLDIVPQHYLLNNINLGFAVFSYHWFFMVQPADFPERLMGADPEYFIRRKLAKTPAGLSFFKPEVLAEYIRCIKNPATIHAMCEDYRATVGVGLDMDTADVAAGRKVDCPVLLLWGATGGVGKHHKPMEVWPRYASNIRRGVALACGHYLSEERPAETAAELLSFFTERMG